MGGSYVTISYRVKRFKFCPCLLLAKDGNYLPLSGVQGIKPGEFQSPFGVRTGKNMKNLTSLSVHSRSPWWQVIYNLGNPPPLHELP